MEHGLAAALAALALGAHAGPGTEVRFPGPGLELAGRLYLPQGPGPFPAIVLMHGCSGLWNRKGREPTANHAFWAEHFRARGYVALLVDSFGPRGEREICTQKDRKITPDQDRPRDAYSSLAWLAARPDVDARRINLLGWSNGAMTVLHALKPDAPGRDPKGPQFRSAVAFYPGCSSLGRQGPFEPIAPLLIQAGGADDWTPARHCEALAARAAKQGAAIEIDVYPEAHHGFDAPGLAVRVRPEVRNTGNATGWGATVGSHPEARARAIARTTGWLAERNR